jgi:hypothetical protein
MIPPLLISVEEVRAAILAIPGSTAVVKPHHIGDNGHQIMVRFLNGYGASIVRFEYSYGGSNGLWELAVIKWDGEEFDFDFTTGITEDVMGHLNMLDVVITCMEISNL